MKYSSFSPSTRFERDEIFRYKFILTKKKNILIEMSLIQSLFGTNLLVYKLGSHFEERVNHNVTDFPEPDETHKKIHPKYPDHPFHCTEMKKLAIS